MKSSSLISFNEPFLTGKETDYISQAVGNKKISGDGFFTKKCHDFFEKNILLINVYLQHLVQML